MNERAVTIKRAFVTTREGRIHYAEAGAGPPVLLLHQTPRSWDEYRDVLPLLAPTHRAIAMDTIGFGESDKPERPMSVEAFGRSVIAFADALRLDRFSLVGHHTGGVIAVEVAGRHPERIDKLVLSGTTCPDGEGRDREWPTIDAVDPTDDGSHLMALWRKRLPYYPPDRPDLLDRLVLDALKVGLDRVEEGHDAVNSFRIEAPLTSVTAPTLLICGSEDWAALPEQDKLASYLPGCQRLVIERGGVALVDHMPREFTDAVLGFLLSPSVT